MERNMRTKSKELIGEVIKKQKIQEEHPEVIQTENCQFDFPLVSVDSVLWARWMTKEISKQLKTLSTKYNRTERVKITLAPFPECLFQALFNPISNKIKEKIMREDTVYWTQVNPQELSYLFGKNWWYIVSLVDKDSRAVNGLFKCKDTVKVQFNCTQNSFLLSFPCELINMYGVAQ